MFKYISENSHKWIKVDSRSAQTDNQLENCLGSDIFTDEITDESSEYSGELDEDKINITPLTSIFKITPSKTDANFSSLYNIIFGWKLTTEYIREENCDFIIKEAIIWTYMRR